MKNVLRARLAIVLLIGAVMAAVIATPAMGIPAFARKYGMSCTTCHAPAPRLKAFGDDFAGNGFVLENQDAPRYTMKTGDDRLDLIRSFPVAARLDGMIKAHSEGDEGVDLAAPYNLKLLSGGSITDNIAYYFYFYLSERGEVAGIEDAYIMFNNLLGIDLDIYAGQFQVSDPLFKRELRLTYEDYEIYKSRSGASRINLAYDRGLMITYGMPDGPDIIVEVLNGNGIGEADEMKTFDDDKYKTVAGRISYDVVDALRIGVFGYYGQEQAMSYELQFNPVTEQFDTLASAARKNTVTYFGPDMTIALDKLELNLQYLQRNDDNPAFDFEKPAEDVSIRGGLAECIFWPNGDQSRWYAVGMYNYIERDRRGDVQTLYHTATGHIGHVLRTNLRTYLEATYDIEDEEIRGVLGFMVGF